MACYRDGVDSGRQLHRARFNRQSDRRAEGGGFRSHNKFLGLFQGRRAAHHSHAHDRDALVMAVTSTKERSFNPLSLDAINFLLADVRGALGPYLNVFLVTQQHWSQSEVGLVTTIGGLIGLAVQTLIG